MEIPVEPDKEKVESETVDSDVETESVELPKPEVEEEPEELPGLELDTEPVAEETLEEAEAALEIDDEELDLPDTEKMLDIEEKPEPVAKETSEEPELEFELEDIDKEETKKDVAETVGLGAQADQLKAEEVEKPKKRISTPVLIVLITALLTGGAYGTYVVLKSMNIKIPFISDLVESAIQNKAGSLKIIAFDITDKFIDNSKVGKLFIISGKVKNEYSGARSFIRVTGKFYAKGKIRSKSATIYCGNVLSDQDLSTMDINSINKKLANRLGDNKSNVNVKPGKLLPFMIVFPNIPDNIFRIVPQYPVVKKFMTVFPNIPGNIEVYTVEVAGSSPA